MKCKEKGVLEMNTKRLHHIFSNYIRKFEYINNSKNNENYKWFIANKFRDLMDPDHPDFAERIREARNLSNNLIDSNHRYCFSALISCCETDTDSVRELFRALFADDGGDLKLRQKKILQFIEDANALIAKLVSTNDMYMNDQRSAMGYLFLYDPDNHYLYKASEATDFASCIEFYDDWGPGTAFRLDVYYRMCDMLVEEIKNCHELVATHKSRYIDKHGNHIEGMHPDDNYHILAFDIIYGAPEFRYNFYEGIPFSTITAQARKLHQERVEKAKELQTELLAVQEKADRLSEARAYFTSAIKTGMIVKHKAYGEGQVVTIDNQWVTINFPQKGETKKFATMITFAGGFLTADIPGLPEKIAQYRNVINGERSIENALARAQKEFNEYKDYLE